MASSGASRPAGPFSQLWQLPLFVVSVALFVYAGYLFINPGPGATVDQKIEVGRNYLKQDRPQAAFQQLVRLLNSEKLEKPKEAEVHVLLAQALDAAQHQLKISIPANHERIIEQSELALEMGAKPDAEFHRRLADSYAALGRNDEAIEHYRDAIALDSTHSLHLLRKLIDLQVAQNDSANADASLDDYLKHPELTDAERAWALSQRAQMLIDQRKYGEARQLLADALKLDSDPVDQGAYNYQIGLSDYREGQVNDAERYLRLARDQLRVMHPLDGEAAYYLGRIYQDRNDPTTAISFYEVVLMSHPEEKIAPLARLGRGICRLIQNQTEPGLTDLHDLTSELDRRGSPQRYRDEAVVEMADASSLLVSREDYKSALEVLGYEEKLTAKPDPTFYARLAHVFEKRADQIEASLADANPTEKIRRFRQIDDFRSRAGDAYILYSHSMEMTDDHGYAEALWKGIDLYDRAGNTQAVITTLELFVAERPSDRLAPDALLRLGQAYRAAAMFDKAISAFQRNAFRYPKSLAASKSAVPLAQAYIAKGPEYYGKAEKTLLSIVENNPLVDPKAEEFRQSLRELAQLYYRMGRYEEAVARLQELTERYPTDDEKPQTIFMMADSYRKSASLLDVKLASAQPATGSAASDVAEAIAAKRDRLQKARSLYDQVLDLYRAANPSDDNDKLYQKLAYFYRADCVYDLGNYDEAIKLYDAAAFNYQNDPSSVAAYVQIVNAYFALGQPEQAKAANNRAKWLLQHMPADAFQDGMFSMPKKYWDQWLQWTGESGMW